MLVNPWSAISDIFDRYPELPLTQLPLAVGFEHDLLLGAFDSISYLYNSADLFMILDQPLMESRHKNLTPLETASHLTHDDTNLLSLITDFDIDKFWIEIDNNNERHQLYFQLSLISLDELRHFLPHKLLHLIRSRISNLKISYIGIVYHRGIRVGYKLLFAGASSYLNSISVSRRELVDLSMASLSNPEFQIGFALSLDSILGESIEVDALKDMRFSSCERWCQLFSSPLFLESNLFIPNESIKSCFGAFKFSNISLFSGINHIKFALKYPSNISVVKLYSGILLSSDLSFT